VVTLAATASDDVGVVGVQFRLDGVDLGAERGSAPYTFSWNTTTVANGAHSITAVARDAAGQAVAATNVTVTVSNDLAGPSVAVTSPVESATVAGVVAIGANATDDVGVVGVQFTLDGVSIGAEQRTAPYLITWNSGSVSNGEHVFAAVARDAAGNTTVAIVTINVENDTTAPTVAVTNPLGLTPVAGTITLAATAADNVGVAGVQWMIDGVNVGAELHAPYRLTWNTTSVSNGGHVIAAVARDAAGNLSTSPGVNITVENGAPTPVP
jgi:hypothetical protein